ncbi:MAG TPA: VanZ family protein [Aequorivita sp.]|nr:VanZ family protein [Aequorivita sp.]
MPLIKLLLESKTWFWLSLIYSGAITTLFLVPTGGFPRVNFSAADKVAHILIFFVLTCLWLSYIFRKTGRVTNRDILILLLSVLFYGIIIEIVQELFTDARTADFWDVMANMGGAIVGVLFFQRVKHFLKT